MKYGIIGAMDEEVMFLKDAMTNKKEETVASVQFTKGEIFGKETVLLKSGIGKVNASMATTILMERYKPTHVINTGSAGGFSSELNVGDVVVGEKIVHHDVDVTAFDYEYGQVPDMPESFLADERLIAKTKEVLQHFGINNKIGLIATGDSFMNDPKRVAFLKEKFPDMLASEMEGAAIAQICFQYDIPFVVVRALSDIAGEESSVTFNEFLQLAAENSSKLIKEIIAKN